MLQWDCNESFHFLPLSVRKGVLMACALDEVLALISPMLSSKIRGDRTTSCMIFATMARYCKPARIAKLGDLATIEFLQGWSSLGVRRRAADDPRLGNHGDVHDSKRLLLSRLGSWKECRFYGTSNVQCCQCDCWQSTKYSSVLDDSRAFRLELLHTFLQLVFRLQRLTQESNEIVQILHTYRFNNFVHGWYGNLSIRPREGPGFESFIQTFLRRNCNLR